MTHYLRLDPSGTNTLIEASEITNLDFQRTQSGLSDFSISVGGRRQELKTHVFDELFLYDGSFLFRGYLEKVDLSKSPGVEETILIGRGVGIELEWGETTRTFTNEFGHIALRDYIDEETNFSAIVTEPEPRVETTEVIQEADTTAEFESIYTVADTEPIEISGDELKLLQTCYPIDATDYTSSTGTDVFVSQEFTGNSPTDCFGSAVLLDTVGETISYEVTLPYDLPAGDWNIEVRYAGSNAGLETEVRIDNNTGTGVAGGTGGSADDLLWFGAFQGTQNDSPISAGTYTIEIELVANSNNADAWIDHIAFEDTRFTHNFDNDVTCIDGVNYLDGPELYPVDGYDVEFTSEDTALAIREITVTGSFNDITNNQRIQSRVVGGSYAPTDGSEDNTSSSTNVLDSPGSEAQGRVRLSAYPIGSNPQDATPRFGYNGQSISTWELEINATDLGVFDDLTVEQSHLQNIQTMASKAGLRFSILHRENSKEIHVFKVGQATKDLPQRVLDNPQVNIKSEDEIKDIRSYFNRVVVKGALDAQDNRIKAEIEDATEIAEVGEQTLTIGPNPDIETEAAAESVARTALAEALQERDETAEVSIPAHNIDVGFSYTVPLENGDITAPLEEVSYTVSAGDLNTNLTLDQRAIELARSLSKIRGTSETLRRGF